MIVIWRGWGLIVFGSLLPLLISVIAFVSARPAWLFLLASTGSLLFAGAVCVYYGTKWNRQHGGGHSFYFVPVQAWGWAFLTLLGLFAALSLGGGVYRAVRPPPGPVDPDRLDPLTGALAGAVGLVIVVGTGWTLVRAARKHSEVEEAGGY